MRLQTLKKPDVKVTPIPLRSMASVVPKERKDATEFGGVVDERSTMLFCLGFRKVEPIRIEQRTILDM